MKRMKGLVLAKMIRGMKVMSVDKSYHVGTKIMIHFKTIQSRVLIYCTVLVIGIEGFFLNFIWRFLLLPIPVEVGFLCNCKLEQLINDCFVTIASSST